MKRAFVILFLLIGTSSGFGAVIHVPSDQPTIQAGIDASVSGDTVFVSPGTYNENIVIDGKAIVVSSTDGRESTFVEPSNGDSDIVTIKNIQDTTCIFEGFTARNAPGGAGIVCYHASPIIMNCTVTNCTYFGINCEYGGARVRGNLIHDNLPHNGGCTGIRIYGEASFPAEVVGNCVYSNSGTVVIGIMANSVGTKVLLNQVWDNVGEVADFYNAGITTAETLGAVVLGNTVVGNIRGIYVVNRGESDPRIRVTDVRNNIVVSNVNEGIWGYPTIDYNCVWGNGSANYPGANGISADPMFVDPDNHDFSLQCGSPCIDAGDPDPIYNDPDGSRNDIGASPFLHESNILHVPQQYGTIQAAINAACEYDTIVVADGHYYERINLLQKALNIASEILIDGDTAHIAATIIDADTSVIGVSDTGCVIYAWDIFGNGQPAEIRGFTLTNGIAGAGGCVMAWRDSIAFSDCIIADNSGAAMLGHGTHIYFNSCSISGCPEGVDWLHDDAVSPNCSFTSCSIDAIPITVSGSIYLTECEASQSDFASSSINSNGPSMILDGCRLQDCTIFKSQDGFTDIRNTMAYGLQMQTIGEIITIQSSVITGSLLIGAGSGSHLHIDSSTVVGEIEVDPAYGSGIRCWFVNSILMSENPILLDCSEISSIEASCCDIFSEAGIWLDCDSTVAIDTSNVISVDPMFCDTAALDFHLSAASPCAPANNSCGVLMGALDVGCSNLCGDVDNSGMIDIDDAIYLINFVYMGGPMPVPTESGDVNCDGGIDLLDIVRIVNYLFRGGSAPCDTDGDGVPDC